MSTRRPKTRWYTTSRRQQERWKRTTATLPDDARAPGHTWVDGLIGRELVGPLPACLPLELADQNLLPAVRAEALERFRRHDIGWHAGGEGPDGSHWCSGHLLDSQVQCVNTFLELANGPDRGLAFVRAVEPDAVALMEVEDGSTVTFEWIGERDHLGERRGFIGQRGRYTTSVDALLVAQRANGGKTGILVEWKFTESYHQPIPFRGPGGKDRREVYRARYEAPGSPFQRRPPIEAYFHEPHYQLLRLVLLADAMVAARELGMDRAVVVHAVPRGNDALLATVPEGLAELGSTVPQVWSTLIGDGPVVWRWLDTTPWLRATKALAERYGVGAPDGEFLDDEGEDRDEDEVTPVVKSKRPPAGSIGPENDLGLILTLDGIKYVTTADGLVEIEGQDKTGLLAPEAHAALDAVMDEAFREVNPCGNPYKRQG